MFAIKQVKKNTKHRSSKKELVLVIETPSVAQWIKKLLIKLLQVWSFVLVSLDKTTGKRGYLLLITGLGLGIGLSVGVISYPQYVNAVPEISTAVTPITIEVTRIKSLALGFDTNVSRGSVELLPMVQLEAPAIHVNGSASINQGQAIIIQGTRADYSFLSIDKAQLGHEIMVLGSNGGWYRYKVVETKVISYDNLGELFAQEHETLVLFTANPLKQTATAVLARPVR